MNGDFPYNSFVCIGCDENKPLVSFQRKRRQSGLWWHSKTCHTCHNKRYAPAQQRWESQNKHKRAASRRRRVESGVGAAYQREWRAKNPGKASAYVRKWQSNNPDAYGVYMKENPWVQRIYNSRRRARRLGAPIDSFKTRELLAAWDSAGISADECFYCDGTTNCIDHVVALSMGGRHAINNVLPACRSCNSSKICLPLEFWVANCRSRPLLDDIIDRVDAYLMAVA